MWQRLRTYAGYLSKPEYFFLFTGGFSAALFCFITPPFHVVDEPTHFYRIAQLSEGHLMPRALHINGAVRYGDTFPESVTQSVNQLVNGTGPAQGEYKKSLIKQNVLHPPHDQKPVKVPFEGSAVYSPITYVPHVIGYTIARIFTDSVAVTMYAARLGNAMGWLLLVFLAIKFAPFGKWAFAALGLLPQIVFSAASLQADTFIVGLCFLLAALIMHLRFSEKVELVPLKYVLGLGAIMSAIALSKFAYAPVFLTLLLIPRQKMRRPYITWAGLIGVPIILTVLWDYAIHDIAGRLNFLVNGVSYGPVQQLHAMLDQPLLGVQAIANSMFSGASDHLVREMLGVFTWFYLSLPLWVQIISVATVVFTLLYQLGRGPVLQLSRKMLVLASLVGSVLLIFVTFYFLWTPAGAHIVLGVQGRYFLPLLPLLILLFSAKKQIINISPQTAGRVVQAGSAVGLCATVIVIVNRFY